MNCLLTIIIAILVLLAVLVMMNNGESFYIEPNTVIGGDMEPDGYGPDPDDNPLELEGPGDAAWSGY